MSLHTTSSYFFVSCKISNLKHASYFGELTLNNILHVMQLCLKTEKYTIYSKEFNRPHRRYIQKIQEMFYLQLSAHIKVSTTATATTTLNVLIFGGFGFFCSLMTCVSSFEFILSDNVQVFILSWVTVASSLAERICFQ